MSGSTAKPHVSAPLFPGRIRPAILYAFVQDGCPACAAMKVELAKFKTQNPSVWVQMLDETNVTHTVQGQTPKALPALVFCINGKIIDELTVIGAVKVKEIERRWAEAEMQP